MLDLCRHVASLSMLKQDPDGVAIAGWHFNGLCLHAGLSFFISPMEYKSLKEDTADLRPFQLQQIQHLPLRDLSLS